MGRKYAKDKSKISQIIDWKYANNSLKNGQKGRKRPKIWQK